MALKITPVTIDGEMRINPETMELLTAFGQHRQFCDDCERAYADPRISPCNFGVSLIHKLLDRPDVQQIPEP